MLHAHTFTENFIAHSHASHLNPQMTKHTKKRKKEKTPGYEFFGDKFGDPSIFYYLLFTSKIS